MFSFTVLYHQSSKTSTYIYSMKLHLSLIYLISRRQHAQNNESFLSSLHHPVHPTVPQVSKCPFFKFALSFTSNCFTTSSWWFPKHCHSVPHTKGRLGFTIVSPTSWKHKVPVTKQKKAEGTTASPSTAAVQAAWREQGWPEKPGLEQLCLSVPRSSTFALSLGLLQNFDLQSENLLRVVHSLLKLNLLTKKETSMLPTMTSSYSQSITYK